MWMFNVVITIADSLNGRLPLGKRQKCSFPTRISLFKCRLFATQWLYQHVCTAGCWYTCVSCYHTHSNMHFSTHTHSDPPTRTNSLYLSLSHTSHPLTHAYHAHARMHTHVPACMHACIHICMRICIHRKKNTYIKIYVHTCIHTPSSTHACTCSYACIYLFMYTYRYTYIYIYIHVHIYIYIFTCVHIYIYI